jgi:diaminopimelate decarboxylase
MTPFDQNSLLELAKHNQTPFYAYNAATIQRDYLSLRQALPDQFRILYSMKANPHRQIVQFMKSVGTDIDVASLRELQLAQDVGFLPEQISFVGPGKSKQELQAIVQAKISCTVVESLSELEQLDQIAQQSNLRTRACVRVNPMQYIAQSGRPVNAASSQFGIDEEQLGEFLKVARTCRSIDIVGVHFYLHSQFLNADNLVTNFINFIEIACEFQRQLDRPLQIVNLGGGFGIIYFNGQKPLDLELLHHKLHQVMTSESAQILREARFMVESGRFLVGPSGVFVSRVLYRKRSRDKIFLVCDGGLAQHLAATGAGQIIRKNFPISLLSASTNETQLRERVTIVGPSCYSLDVLGHDVDLPQAAVGDLICIGNSGAYGPTFSPTHFLSPAPTREIFVAEN